MLAELCARRQMFAKGFVLFAHSTRFVVPPHSPHPPYTLLVLQAPERKEMEELIPNLRDRQVQGAVKNLVIYSLTIIAVPLASMFILKAFFFQGSSYLAWLSLTLFFVKSFCRFRSPSANVLCVFQVCSPTVRRIRFSTRPSVQSSSCTSFSDFGYALFHW